MTLRSNVPGTRRRRSFTREYKAEAVRLRRLEDWSNGEVAKDLATSSTGRVAGRG